MAFFWPKVIFFRSDLIFFNLKNFVQLYREFRFLFKVCRNETKKKKKKINAQTGVFLTRYFKTVCSQFRPPSSSVKKRHIIRSLRTSKNHFVEINK